MHRRHRRRSQDYDNLDRWLVSYADFMTLLFAFFVVMYAISSINEGKYRVLSDSLVSAFRTATNAQGVATALDPPVQIPPIVVPPKATAVAAARESRATQMKNVAKDILDAMAPLVKQGKVAVIETDRGVTIEINDSLLFSPGQATLDPAGAQAIRAVAAVIAESDFAVTIEGHTDNIPINTVQFPSNWELSAVRATSVLRLFADSGVAPARLTAIGYGDQRPVAANDSAEGRARNRRVAIQIEASVVSPDAAVVARPLEGSLSGR